MKKNIMSFLLVSVMIMSMTVFTFANSIAPVLQKENILPRIEAPCPVGNGIHQMKRMGLGSVFTDSGTTLIEAKPCWQCDNCYDVIITSGDPVAYGGIVGYYAMGGSEGPISSYGTQIYVPNNYSLGYCGTKTMQGFRFYNQQVKAVAE